MPRDTRKEILVSDLSVCRPKSALAKRYVPGRWKLLPYEHDKFRGVMLGAIAGRDAAPLKLPLKSPTRHSRYDDGAVKGWYEIYVGLYRTYEPVGVRLRLSSDRAFRKFHIPVKWDFSRLLAVVEEHFWKAADLTGESIHIAPLQPFGLDMDNYVAHFRLVPLSAAKVRALKKDRGRKDSKRLMAMNDGTDIIGAYSLCRKRDFADEVDTYKDTDFRGMTWEFIKGDMPQFPVPGLRQRRFPRDALIPIKLYENVRRMWKRMDAAGFNPLRVLRDLTRSAGLELHVSHRMGHASQVPYEDFAPTDFHKGKYGDYCRLADGTPVQRFSYAKPHVQDKMLRLYAAAAQYGVDGFLLIFKRGGPVVLYEEEMVARFRQAYGTRADPRKLPLHDKRLVRVRAGIFGEYLRRLRATINKAARGKGHKPPIITAYGLGDAKACAVFGLDFAGWAREGLVDRVLASPWGTVHFGTGKYEWPHFDVDFYRACVAGTRAELWAEIPRPPQDVDCGDYYRRIAQSLYRKGIQGFYFWGTWGRHAYPAHFNVLSVLGHEDDLAQRLALARKRSREVLLKKLAGVDLRVDRFPPWLSG